MTPLAVRSVGDGPPVVWLHGYTMDSSIWSDLWSRLPGWTHVGVDLPGHGGSDRIVPGTTLADAAAAVAEVSRSLGAVRMVALSFGTIVALQVALDHPDVCPRLILSAPAMSGGATEPGADVRYTSMMRLAAGGAMRAELVDEWMTAPPDIFTGTLTKPVLRFRLRSVIMRHSWAELETGSMATMLRHRHVDADLERVSASLLVLVGDQDLPVTVAVSTRLERLVSEATRVVIPDAGHLAPLERPADVAPIIAAYLSHDAHLSHVSGAAAGLRFPGRRHIAGSTSRSGEE